MLIFTLNVYEKPNESEPQHYENAIKIKLLFFLKRIVNFYGCYGAAGKRTSWVRELKLGRRLVHFGTKKQKTRN